MKKGFDLPPSSGFKIYNLASMFLLISILPGLTKHYPLLTYSFNTPLSKTPTLSPASPKSNVFLKVSIPVIVVGIDFLFTPIKWTSSPTLHFPYSTVPVTTVPLPEILTELSTDIKKSLSFSL